MHFLFGETTTDVIISREIPGIENFSDNFSNSIIIADENTVSIAKKISGRHELPLIVLESGEEFKKWGSVEKILSCAHKEKLGRDSFFIAVGGGVIGDLTGFAASIYKRGCRFILISTTLLGMVDASVGGKTGFDLFEIKNLVGSFFPAEKVYIPLDTLSTLPQNEWKSGMAELIKTAILCPSDNDEFLNLISSNIDQLSEFKNVDKDLLLNLVERAVSFKGSIVSEDPKETGTMRILLNLGHTFAHALESACGLGNISHGEAVAWGIVRACELGCILEITPEKRAQKIINIIKAFNYITECPHPLCNDMQILLNAIKNDKKNKAGNIRFIVPASKGAVPVTVETENGINMLMNILQDKITI